ncbi:MAG: MBL fold metallo-hydrolase [Verrucomicrobiota bacterium]
MQRRSLLKLTALAPVAAVHGQIPSTQVSGFQRFRVGQFTGTAFLDGHLQIGAEAFADLSEAEADELAQAAFLDGGQIDTGVNAYVLQSGDETILIDAGGAGAMEPLGGLAGLMEDAGVAADQVSHILITHLHPDHIGGLLTETGDVVFPNAKVRIHQADIDGWTTEAALAQAPEGFKPFFEFARKVYLAYEAQVVPFTEDTELVPGVSSRHLPGHTAGHTGFVIEDGDDPLLIWGDIVHVEAYQMPRPDLAIGFDTNPDLARETRLALLPEVAGSKHRIAGMHLSFPGIGRVAKDGDGYRFDAEDWTFEI